VAKRLKDEEEDQYTFDQEIIFIRKVVDSSSNTSQDESGATDDKDCPQKDPDFAKVILIWL
jgi:hypothetical protein